MYTYTLLTLPCTYQSLSLIHIIIGIQWAGDIAQNLSKWESEGVYLRIPEGADFINSGHFSGIFVYHTLSHTIHIDDTLSYFDENAGCCLPCLFQCIGGAKANSIMLHTTTFDEKEGSGLYCTEVASDQFKAFLERIVVEWEFDNMCTAHKGMGVFVFMYHVYIIYTCLVTMLYSIYKPHIS